MNNYDRAITYHGKRYVGSTLYKCTTNNLTDEDTYYKWVEKTKEWLPVPETWELYSAFFVFKRSI